MPNYENGYYRFSDGSYHLEANGATSVRLSAVSGQQNQFWHYDGTLKSEKYPSAGLKGSSSVSLSSDADTISVVMYETNKCYIKNNTTGKYLYQSSGSLSWSTNKTYWTIERVYRQTGVPKYDPEYFSATSGMSDGSWNTYWTGYLKAFFARLYGGSSSNVTSNNIGQCMYGAIYGSGPYKGKFHTGLDFYKGGSSTVKCPFNGIYLGNDPNYGCVYVYNNAIGCTFVFMHMDIDSDILMLNAGDTITQGTPMGRESNVAADSQHLHIEVHAGRVNSIASIPAKSFDDIGSIIPYAAIYQIL